MNQAVLSGQSASAMPPARAWRRALPALLLAWAWVLFLGRDAAIGMVGIWLRSETFTHCLLIPPISAWLVWRKRTELAAMTPAPAWPALALLVLSGIGWLVGRLAATDALTHFALVGMLVACVPAMLGARVAGTIMFPLGFLFLAVPFGEFVMPTMMEWTANVTVLALTATGVPVYREGLQFVIPSGNWSVVEACSGVRYLIASFTVGTLFAYLNYRSALRRVLFMLVSLLVPVVANWARAYIIVMLGHLSSNKLAVGVDHLIYGWLFFGVVIMLMFAIGARWSEDEAPPAAVAPGPAATLAQSTRAMLGMTAMVVGVVAAAPLAEALILRGESNAAVSITLPDAVDGWRRTDSPSTDWRPAFEIPAAEARATFSRDGRRIGMHVGYYRQQSAGRKMVGSESALVKADDPNWARTGSAVREVAVAGRAVHMQTFELRGAPLGGAMTGTRLEVWQFYWVDGRLTSSASMVKALTAWSRLTGNGDDSAVILVYAIKGPESAAAIERFVQAAGDPLERLLRSARSGG